MKYLFILLMAFAHEGHDHDAPATVQAPKGGMIKSLEQTHVEVLSQGSALKIYLYGKDLKTKPLTGFKVSAQVERPRSSKKEPLSLTAREGYYEAQYEAKGLHRYTLILSITDPQEGHADELKFTVEPGKSGSR